MERCPAKPSWDRLFEAASAQQGLFTTAQAREAGYSPQLLVHHVRARRIVRVRRGVYRLVHFPVGEREDLVAIWLWAERVGVFSHQTALALQGLSDALPSQVHLTLPEEWKKRRLRVPAGVVLHYAELSAAERAWFGTVPITSPGRTLSDCAREHFSPELLSQAAGQALRRGLVAKSELRVVGRALEPFGGLPG